MDKASENPKIVPSHLNTRSGNNSNLNPIDMSTLHSLSPGGNTIPAPPPPSPLLFSANSSSSTSTTEQLQLSKLAATSSKSETVPASSSTITSAVAPERLLKLGGGGSSGDKASNSPIRRFFIPPTLEKKHSSGDLHSRLKTRKILGVGETDNGDIHRSKISQVLGHNEHLYLKLPMGYWNWQIFLSGFMASQATLLILFPTFSNSLGIVGIPPPLPLTDSPPVIPTTSDDDTINISNSHSNPNPVQGAAAIISTTAGGQYYGAALLALAFLSWKFLHVNDKMIIRATQFATLVHFTMICCVDVLSILHYGLSAIFETLVLLMFGLRLAICIICYMYLNRLGLPAAGLRRSPSYKESFSSIDYTNNGTNNITGSSSSSGGSAGISSGIGSVVGECAKTK